MHNDEEPESIETEQGQYLLTADPQILKSTQLSGEIQVLEPEFPFLTRLV
jgi:hypothetical protein